MSMPWQLREGFRRRQKGSPSSRPIAEQLLSINVNDLAIPSPYDYKTYILPYISLRCPQLASARICFHFVEFRHPPLHRGQEGPTQTFQFKHIRTGFGIRHAFICGCQRPVIKLLLLPSKSCLPTLHPRSLCLADPRQTLSHLASSHNSVLP